MMQQFVERGDQFFRQSLEEGLVRLLERPVVGVDHPFSANEPQPEKEIENVFRILRF